MRRNRCYAFFALALALAAQPALAEVTIKTTNISHGIEAWYAPNDTVSVVDVVMSIEGAGTISDPAGKEGRAEIATALLTRGAGTLDAKAFARALDEEAISLDIHAEQDRLMVHVYCLREHAAKAGELLALALTKPTLTEADLALVKTQTISQLTQMQESPGYQASRLLDSHAFKGHPYANPGEGTSQSVATITSADVRDYLSHYVTRGNIIIAAAGDVDGGLLDTLVKPAIDALPEAKDAIAPVAPVAMQGGGEVLHQKQEVPQTVITFAAPGVARDDKRFYAVYLLNEILGGGTLTSRFAEQVRQQRGLVYGIGSGLDIRQGVSLLSGELATRNSTADKALSAVKEVLGELHDKGVTTEECNDAKSYVLGHLPLQLDSSREVASLLFTMQRFKLGEDYLETRAKKFKEVSCSDINAVARDLLAPTNFLFAVVGGTSDEGAPPIATTPSAADAH